LGDGELLIGFSEGFGDEGVIAHRGSFRSRALRRGF
jgi:hypothetical protein